LEQASDRFRKKRVIAPQITQTENVALTYASAIDDMQARTISCVLLLFSSAACVCSKKQTFINLLYYILLYDALLQLARAGRVEKIWTQTGSNLALQLKKHQILHASSRSLINIISIGSDRKHPRGSTIRSDTHAGGRVSMHVPRARRLPDVANSPIFSFSSLALRLRACTVRSMQLKVQRY